MFDIVREERFNLYYSVENGKPVWKTYIRNGIMVYGEGNTRHFSRLIGNGMCSRHFPSHCIQKRVSSIWNINVTRESVWNCVYHSKMFSRQSFLPLHCVLYDLMMQIE